MVESGSAPPTSSQALLDAVVALTSAGDVSHVLARIVASACELTEDRYGALGVIGAAGSLSDFITHGLDEVSRGQIGDLPQGRGILRLLIDHPEPIRLDRLSDHAASFGFPPHHPPMTSFLGVPLRIRGTVFGNLYLTEKREGQPFTDQDEMLVLALAGAAGFVLENARAYALSERQRSWLEASALLHQTLQAPIELAAALPHIIAGAQAVSGALAVGAFGLEAETPVLIAADGRESGALADAAALLDSQLRGAFRAEQPDEAPLARDRSVLFVPLRTQLLPRLVLALILDSRPDPTRQPAQEQALAMSFADQAALALDRLQALTDREAYAVVADRDRIARDLHDVVIQRLFATGLQLQGARAMADPAVRERMDQAVRDLDTTIRDIRGTIFELKHRSGDPVSVRHQASTLVTEYAVVLGFAPTLRVLGPVDTLVDADIGEHLLVVLREALSNVARHADATSVLVEIEATPQRVSIRVSDDGRGLPTEREESGLRNVRQRATELGGAAELVDVQPHGTALSWHVPLASPQDRVGLHH